jgi:hypothetical protein
MSPTYPVAETKPYVTTNSNSTWAEFNRCKLAEVQTVVAFILVWAAGMVDGLIVIDRQLPMEVRHAPQHWIFLGPDVVSDGRMFNRSHGREDRGSCS